MAFDIKGIYNPTTNIAVVIHSGTPSSETDLERLYKTHLETWANREYKVYVITDLTDSGKLSYKQISSFFEHIGQSKQRYVEFSVIVANKPASKLTAKLYELISEQNIATTMTMSEAMEIVKTEQFRRGKFVPLAQKPQAKKE